MSLSERLRRIELQQEEQRQTSARLEQKLDALIRALAAEGEEEPQAPGTSLDGDALPGERNQSQSLG
ncbi:hypothetical protein [Stenotrophomonas sp. SrG]|uniref:hypothetical protein n=1 Tax=Stenotrophomonas sp. SrG TaxID=3414430 RepID=UPI003CE6CDC1